MNSRAEFKPSKQDDENGDCPPKRMVAPSAQLRVDSSFAPPKGLMVVSVRKDEAYEARLSRTS